jgi:hypothetical protein
VAVLKVASSRLAVQAEQFANELTRYLDISAPECRIIRQVRCAPSHWGWRRLLPSLLLGPVLRWPPRAAGGSTAGREPACLLPALDPALHSLLPLPPLLLVSLLLLQFDGAAAAGRPRAGGLDG